MRARELGAGTDPDDQPAVGDPVESGQAVRQRQGMPQQRQQDGGAERDATRRTGNSGEQCDGFAPRTGEQRVADPYRVITVLLGPPSRLNQKGQVAVRPQQDLARRKQKASFGCLCRHAHQRA